MRINYGNLKVDPLLDELLRNEILPETGLTAEQVWAGFEGLLDKLAPRNKALLEKRLDLQKKLNHWHQNNAMSAANRPAYKSYLQEIGYLVDEGEDFCVDASNIDAEIATVAGPQLVVPINNARFVLNAVNARWGSLYDAYYGSDVIDKSGPLAAAKTYNAARGAEVIRLGAEFLDTAAALENASHADVANYQIVNGQLQVELKNGETTQLREQEKFIGYRQTPNLCVLLRNNGLHIELTIDRHHPIGSSHQSGIADIIMEAALSTILDCEDSVAAVDAEDKVLVYRNCLGTLKSTLSVNFEKNGKTQTRTLNPDRQYTAANGEALSLSGRSLLLIRNVGHLMTTDAVLDGNDQEVPEGFLDALITSLCASHDVRGSSALRSSRAGSIYIVKPKMHGPEEVQLSSDLFAEVEDIIGLPRFTLKMGIMDEERRTTVNLKACINAAKSRLFFINTGFLDRTGDEIHTSNHAGAMLPKEAIKSQPWIAAYEDWNVDIGLACGLRGRAQIGKGMWARPDDLGAMVKEKIAHPKAGASCAWVPAPIGAVLHSTHYHQVNVAEIQTQLSARKRASLDDLLTPPLLAEAKLDADSIHKELENNAQSILGYVVRWIDLGVGCSKVPDINDIALMEDRATLRISAQLLANWLLNDVCTEAQVIETLKRMALVVDQQNRQDPQYTPMAPSYDGLAFKAACELILKGSEQPSGYTEPLLHALRRSRKAELRR